MTLIASKERIGMAEGGIDMGVSTPYNTLYFVYFESDIVACLVSFLDAVRVAESHANYKLTFHPVPNDVEWVSLDNYTIALKSMFKEVLDTGDIILYNGKYSLDSCSKDINL